MCSGPPVTVLGQSSTANIYSDSVAYTAVLKTDQHNLAGYDKTNAGLALKQ